MATVESTRVQWNGMEWNGMEWTTEKGLPTYTILQQKALIGVANTLPVSGRDLLKIPGIGKKIVENYGAKLLEIVDEYRKGQ